MSSVDPIWTTMGEIAEVIGGGTPRTNDSSNFDGGDIPWITPADLSGYTAKYIARGNRSITKKGLSSSSARLLPPGTVLFTSRAPIGYVAIASNTIATNQGFKSFVLREGVSPDYVYWWLKGAKRRAEQLASGTTFLELSGANAKKLPIPMVPREKQDEIVSEIETQFSRLDEAVAGLQRVKANVKRYKAAVLKSAVTGRLVPTEADLARREGRNYETGAQFLQRILETRRSQWQGKGKYKEPAAPDTIGLPELPDGWVWSTADQICSQITDGEHIQPRYKESGFPMLTAKNVRDGFVDFGDVGYIAENDFEACLRRCAPVEGDLLIVSVGATTGRSAIVARCEPFALVRSVLLLRPVSAVPPNYILCWLQSPWCQTYIQRASGATAQAHLYIKDTRTIPVPLPPLPEQHCIVAEADRLLSIAREVEAEVDANLKRAQGLRQAILGKVFQPNGDTQ